MSDEMQREVMRRAPTVGVLPYDPVRDEVVLIEQFRIGNYAAGVDPWEVEIVAGIMEPGETPDDVARRETLEEAGVTAGELIPAGAVLLSPGACTEVMTMFCARVDASNAGGIHGLDHEHEDIRVFTRAAEAAIADLGTTAYVNAPVLMLLQWLALNRARVRAAWG